MSHPEQMAFLKAVVDANAELVTGGKVLEIGSYDVNGSVRNLFVGCSDYVGVDLSPGPGVDMVSFGHELTLPDRSFDVCVSAECFEHDPHWAQTFTSMVRLTRPGGIVAFTCATRGRPEHGTRRTRLNESPGTQAVGIDYYRNLTDQDFEDALPIADWFDESCFWASRYSFDLYFLGVVRGASAGRPTGRMPHSSHVAAIDELMTRIDRLIRLPLRVGRTFVRSEDRYQRLFLRYWKLIHRLRGAGHVSRVKQKLRRAMNRVQER